MSHKNKEKLASAYQVLPDSAASQILVGSCVGTCGDEGLCELAETGEGFIHSIALASNFSTITLHDF